MDSGVFATAVPLSGIGPVLDYSVTLFKRAGLDGLGANGVDVLIKGMNFAMTFPALFLADRFGRRPLMIVGSLIMTIALAKQEEMTGIASAACESVPKAKKSNAQLF